MIEALPPKPIRTMHIWRCADGHEQRIDDHAEPAALSTEIALRAAETFWKDGCTAWMVPPGAHPNSKKTVKCCAPVTCTKETVP